MGKSRKFRRAKGPPAQPDPEPAPAPQGQLPCTCKFWYLVLLVLLSVAIMTWALYVDRWSTSDGIIHGIFRNRNEKGHEVRITNERAVQMSLMKTGLAVIMPLLGIQATLFLRGFSFKYFNVFTAIATIFVPMYYANTSGLEEMLPSYFLSILALAPLFLILLLAP